MESWIAAGASIVAALIAAGVAYLSSRRTVKEQRKLAEQQAIAQRELEQLKTTLTLASAKTTARQAYEYEARKRLYAEAEPLLFQFYENSSYAINRITNLARASREGNLPSWLDDRDEYYFRSTLHSFLVPLASVHILRDRLTALDLSLDPAIERQYEISKAINRAFNRDRLFAVAVPPLNYVPYADHPGNPFDVPQGVVGGEVQRAISTVVKKEGDRLSIKAFWEFSEDFENSESATRQRVAAFANVWRSFSPVTRPVLWRIIIAQLFLYRAARFSREFREKRVDTEDILRRVELTPAEKAQFAFSTDPSHAAEVEAAFSIGAKYLEDALRSSESPDVRAAGHAAV